MRIISTPPAPERGPKPPGWCFTMWLRTGTVVEHNGVTWELTYVGAADQEWREWVRVKSA